jgi:hypothetical protein
LDRDVEGHTQNRNQTSGNKSRPHTSCWHKMAYSGISMSIQTGTQRAIQFPADNSNYTRLDTTREEKQTTTKTTKNSVVWIRERTIPTERPPFVGEVSASFLRI